MASGDRPDRDTVLSCSFLPRERYIGMKAKMRKLIEHVKNDQEEAATALARMGGRKAEAALEIRGTADEARLAHEAEAALEVRGTAEQVRLAHDRGTCRRINSSSSRRNRPSGWLLALGTLRSVSNCSQRAQRYIHRREVEKLDAIDGRSRAGARRSRIAPATEQGQRECSQQKRPLGVEFCSLPQR